MWSCKARLVVRSGKQFISYVAAAFGASGRFFGVWYFSAAWASERGMWGTLGPRGVKELSAL